MTMSQLCIHLPIDEHLGSFQFLTNKKNAAIKYDS